MLPTPDKEVILKNTQTTVTPEVRGTFITPTLTPKKVEKVILLPTITEQPTPIPTPQPTIEIEEYVEEEYVEEWEEPVSEPEPEKESNGGSYLGTWVATGYCNCEICCGSWANGVTASGAYPTAGYTVASDLPFGTVLSINDNTYVVEDRGVGGEWVDIYFDSHEEALAFGMQYVEVYLVE